MRQVRHSLVSLAKFKETESVSLTLYSGKWTWPHPSPDPDLENWDNNDTYLMIIMIIVEII